MALSLVTAPTHEPVSLDEAKQHLRVDVSDEDALIQTLIEAAREHVETYTGRALITQTWDLKLDAFPCSGSVITLPKPPVTSITSISYVDTSGDSQTWSSSLWDEDLPSGPKAQPARIAPAYAESYPSTRGQMNAVTIRFVCGYGSAGAVPRSIRAGMLLLIGHWYQNREAVVVGVGMGAVAVPDAVDALLWPYRVS